MLSEWIKEKRQKWHQIHLPCLLTHSPQLLGVYFQDLGQFSHYRCTFRGRKANNSSWAMVQQEFPYIYLLWENGSCIGSQGNILCWTFFLSLTPVHPSRSVIPLSPQILYQKWSAYSSLSHLSQKSFQKDEDFTIVLIILS